MRFSRGFVQISRQEAMEMLHKSPNAAAIYLLLRCWANYEKSVVFIGKKSVEVLENQVLTGVGELSRSTGISWQSVNKSLKLLKSLGLITSSDNLRECRKFTLKANSKQETGSFCEPYDYHQDKEELRTNKEEGIRKSPPISKEEEGLASDWLAWSLTVTPSIKAKVSEYAVAVSKFCRIEKMEINDLRSMFEFIRKDEFWTKNAISPAGLRTKSKNGLLKYQNILNDMKPVKRHAGIVLKKEDMTWMPPEHTNEQ